MFDMDNDGYRDIFVTNGINHDLTDIDFVNFFANVNASYTDNKIARSRTIGNGLAQRITSVNTDGDWTYNGNLNFGTPIRALGMKTSISLSGMYNRGIEFINAEESTSRTLRNTVRTTLENRDKERFDLAATASFTFNDVKYSLNEQQIGRAHV